MIANGSRAIGPRLRACEVDADAAYALLTSAAAWLAARRIAQWNPPYPRELFARDVDAGHVWCWKSAEQMIATVTLLPHRPAYYPMAIWNDGSPAWYVCRLAVTRALTGQGVGRRVLALLEDDARAAGRSALRIDVSATHPFLEKYYAALGFVVAGTGEIFGTPATFLERQLHTANAAQ